MFVKFIVLLLPFCRGFFVEVSLVGRNESDSLKLVCGPPAANLNVKSDHEVLWSGSQFGASDHDRLSDVLHTDDWVPDLSINSSERHLCHLLAARNALSDPPRHTKRISRDSLDSIPADKGLCPPGYRIHQDRCFPCFPGSYASGQESECFLCPKNFYTDRRAADSCWPCPDGKSTPAEGADSEGACVYLDDSGHPVPVESPPWIVIYCLIGVILASVWIGIVLLLVRYYKEMKGDDARRPKRGEGRKDWTTRWPLLRTPESSPSEHEYAEIDEQALYEEPRKTTAPPVYLDLEAPAPPPTPKRRRSSPETDIEAQRGTEDGPYEVPIRKTDVEPTTSDEHTYEVPIPKTRDVEYEEPIRKESKQDTGSQTSSDTLYVLPSRSSSDLLDAEPSGESREERLYQNVGSRSHDSVVRPDEREGVGTLNIRESRSFQPLSLTGKTSRKDGTASGEHRNPRGQSFRDSVAEEDEHGS